MGFLNLLKRSQNARIVNVSSGSGQLKGMGSETPAYGVSKAALNALTLKLAAELPNMRINAVCPGWINTDSTFSILDIHKIGMQLMFPSFLSQMLMRLRPSAFVSLSFLPILQPKWVVQVAAQSRMVVPASFGLAHFPKMVLQVVSFGMENGWIGSRSMS